MTIFNDTLTQGIGTAFAQVVGQTAVATDDIGSHDTVLKVYARSPVLAEGIGSHDVVAPAIGAAVLEQLRIALATIPNHKFHFSLSDILRIAQALNPAVPVTLTQGMGVALTQSAQLSLQIIEELGLEETLGPTLKYRQTIADTLRVADLLGRFFGGEIVDAINIQQTQIAVAAKLGSINEGVGVVETINPRLVLRVVVEDEINLTDTATLNAIFSPVITDGFEVTAAYLAPNGNISTWAMNTRTGAVSEYSNYEFNSFARVDNKYLGASDSGLYELLGDDDDGTDIVAHIKSGFAQWTGARFTMFKGIYVAARGAGDYVLKVTTGDGKTYNYSFTAQSMKTAKVRTGKGMRARYFAFELISTGQDFDLDSLEFVPVVTDRRV